MIPNSKYTVQNTKYPVPSIKYTVPNTYYAKYVITQNIRCIIVAHFSERDTHKDAVRNQLVLGGSGIGSCEGKLSSRQGRLCL